MLRWFGMLLIVCGGLLTRQALVDEMRRAQRIRSDLAAAFEAMEAEVRLLLTPMPALLRRTYGVEADAFLRGVSVRLACGTALETAWRDAAEGLALPEAERMAVATLGGRLDSGEEGVCAALALTASELRRDYDRNEVKRGERERLTTSICISISLFLGLLLL